MAANRPKSDPRGWLITLEGPEGAGKTSQAEGLHRAMIQGGRDAILVREPGATPAGEQIRRLLLDADPVTVPISPRTDALLFNAARAQLVHDVIRPAIVGGRIVICSRYVDSTLAYQGYGMGLPLAELRSLEQFATQGLGPDFTVLIDLPVEVGLARKRGLEVTRFEAAFDFDFHRRVRAGFLALASEEPARFTVVDGEQPAAAVFAEILAAVERIVGPVAP